MKYEKLKKLFVVVFFIAFLLALSGNIEAQCICTTTSENTFLGLSAGSSNTGQRNTFLGYGAGYTNTNGSYNTFLGFFAGMSNTEGGFNTFLGANAGKYNTTGGGNTFLGVNAGFRNTTASGNTFLGYYAGRLNKGGYNTFLGYEAGKSNTTASGNTFLGYYAGRLNTGGYNTFLGDEAGCDNTTGIHNTFLGYQAGYSNNTASNNTILGYGAGYFNTGSRNTFLGFLAGHSNTVNGNTFLGYEAGCDNTTGTCNTFLGYNAGSSNTYGGSNTFLGYQAGCYNNTGTGNTFLGYNAGYANTKAICNTFLGFQAGYYNSDDNAKNNTFIGYHSGYKNKSGRGNTFIGMNAGYKNTEGNGNIFLGTNAGFNEIGSNKLYIDKSETNSPLIYGEFDNDIVAINGKLGIGTKKPGFPLELKTTGENAIFIAERTGGATAQIIARPDKTMIGSRSNHNMNFCVNNDAKMTLDTKGYLGIGTLEPKHPLELKTTGEHATFIAERTNGAAAQISARINKTMIGSKSNHNMNFCVNDEAKMTLDTKGHLGIGTNKPDHPLELQTTDEHATFIAARTDGATAQISARINKTMIGSKSNHNMNFCVNDEAKMTLDTDGKLGIGTTSPSHPLEVATANGAYLDTTGNWVNPSSRELKENIEELPADQAMETLKGLNPVKYNYKVDKEEEYIGFIAEDVPELVAVKGRKGMVPMDVVAVLTKVVKEQQKTIEKLNERIAKLEGKK